ncbi:hypothetical protein KJ359_010005 [Pestalotiopsis sp. 9143b]|nr:hypothetical protein KJ359_010005 [Pestalotiopsis sp. 9143b]
MAGGENDMEIDDDNVSLTSTRDSDHDSDEEFVVDAILGERPHETMEGEKQYLIQWEGYPIFRSTWEGIENLSDELCHQWCLQRDEEKEQRRRPFDLQIYENAVAEEKRRKAARHSLRNDKRKRLGLPLTRPFPAGYVGLETTLDIKREDSDSSDEALEVRPEIDPATNISRQQRVIKQSTFKGVPAAKQSSKTSTTGWQGTARKPSDPNKVATKPTTVVARSNSTSNVASSSSLAHKFKGKRLKATRSVPRPAATKSNTSHATATAKVRKPRAGLKSAMMDPNKAPKFMSNMHKVNQLKKKADELNDSAPADPSTIPAGYFITDAPPQRPATPKVPETEQSNIQSILDEVSSSTALPKDRETPLNKKTVRFAENIAATQTFVETDPPSGPALKKVSLQSYQRRLTSQTQTVAKKVSFGASTSETVQVEFANIPRTSSSDWLKQFISEEIMQFQSLCTHMDFFYTASLYDPQNPSARLASGTLESSNALTAVTNVTTNLKASSSAFYIPYAGYSVLVYPGQCLEWAPLMDKSGSTTSVLNYLVFRPKTPFRLEHYPALSNASIRKTTTSSDLQKELMQEIADFDYDILLAPSAGEKHVFFLMYTQEYANLFKAISLWLRACRPDCQIFHSGESGAWSAYKNTTHSGAVILHQSVEHDIKNIPGLWDTLKHSAHIIWSLSSTDHETALRLSPAGDLITGVPPQLRLKQLLTAGRAFLVTPGFAISQPRRMCEFLEYFKERAAVAPCVLVVCADFADYLLDVATEKAQEGARFLEEYPGADNDMMNYAQVRSISKTDIEAKVHAWRLVKEISEQDGDLPEHMRLVVQADDLLAPDDEQSLVHWYAAWSLTRLDMYRKFYVLGSSIDKQPVRTIRIPNYMPGVVNDPDDMGIIAEEEATAPPQNGSHGRIFQNDGPPDIATWISSRFNHLKGRSSFWMYWKPIAWVDEAMAQRCGDRGMRCLHFEAWFTTFKGFWSKVTTLAGIFYTPGGRPEELNAVNAYVRHPWLAFLRPVHNSNLAHVSEVELLIWDCTAEHRWPTQPGLKDLLPMQQSLIDFLKGYLPRRFPNYRLERVWVGGQRIVADADPASPLDATCKTLEAIVNSWQPWPTTDDELFSAGWENLQRPKLDFKKLPFPRIPADDAEPKRIIFHPAKRRDGREGRGSLCGNILYDAALQARVENPQCTEILYQFPHTTSWYANMQPEKRLYNHILVGSWNKVFDDCKIPYHGQGRTASK